MTRAQKRRRDQDRGSIDRLPSGAIRVRVFAGSDPVTGRRHDLTEVLPANTPDIENAAERVRNKFIVEIDERRNPKTKATVLLDAPEHGCARVEWDSGPVGYTATDLLSAATESPEERGERRDAADWLRYYLIEQGGSAALSDIVKAAKAEGISDRTLRRARVTIGVTIDRSGFPARSVWRIDPDRAGQSGHQQ